MTPRNLHALLRVACLLVGMLLSAPAQSQFTSDIDIYARSSTSTSAANVLIVVDNTANWSAAFNNEMAALITSVNALPRDQFRVGLMLFTESGTGNSGNDGAYVRSAIRLLDADYQTKFKSLIGSFDKNSDKSNGGKAGLTMAEAYYYFTGQAPYAGNNKVKTDYLGNTSGTSQSKAIYALPNNAMASFAANRYVSPILDGCQRNYIIYVSNGAVQDNAADTSNASTRLSAAYSAAGLTQPADIVLSPNGSQSNVADEWARFMKASPQNIKTYTMDVDKILTGQGPGWSALLKSMAVSSGGQYYDVNSSVGGGAQIVDAFTDVFNQIQSVDSVFASASLPISTSARGTFLNQVFMGVFRPDGDAKPRWRGNLKQYSFRYDPATDSLSLGDAQGNPAVSGATGFVSPSAVSYWTQSSSFWTNQRLGTPPTASDSPDGEVVEKGGVAQGIRSTYATTQAGRKVYTCVGCITTTDLTLNNAKFDTGNALLIPSLFGFSLLDSTSKNNLVNWVRGTDNAGDEVGPGGTTTIRPSVHGDVLHSRPAVVNYGGSTGVVVFYGSNDGTLRAVNGNQSGTDAGQELWSFVPEEFFGQLNRLRANSPEIRLSTTTVPLIPSASDPSPRNYYFDGPISIYQKMRADGTSEKVYAYATTRRGGRLIYAFDVTIPTQPKFLWKKNQLSIPILGQTWSEPQVAKIKGRTNPVVIMGAGYDSAAEDAAVPGITTQGNAVLVLDAFDGSLVKLFPTERSVPASVSLVDSDSDGFIDRAYAVDMGGNLYRIDFENNLLADLLNWGMYKLASLNGGGTRKFFYGPDVVVTRSFTAVLLGSGDREKPLTGTSSDRFFTVYDKRLVKGTPTLALLSSPLVAGDLGRVGTSESFANGCYIAMSTSGEKVVTAPLTVAGVTYFSTNRPTPPASGSCSANLGEAKVYAAPLFCKAPESKVLLGGGLPPSPIAGDVLVTYTPPGATDPVVKKVPFVIGAPNPKDSTIEPKKVTLTVPPNRVRKYWFVEGAR